MHDSRKHFSLAVASLALRGGLARFARAVKHAQQAHAIASERRDKPRDGRRERGKIAAAPKVDSALGKEKMCEPVGVDDQMVRGQRRRCHG